MCEPGQPFRPTAAGMIAIGITQRQRRVDFAKTMHTWVGPKN